MRLLLIALLFIFFPVLSSLHAEEIHAGFVQGIWYSQPDVFAGDTIRIYVALRNNTDHDLTGTIRFTDNGTRIGNAYVTALPGRIVEGWVDWTPVYGEHAIAATLTDIRSHEIGATPEQVTVESPIEDTVLMVDYDTDSDNIGNATDTDDDGDGASDTSEAEAGTDPLVPNTTPQAVSVADDTPNTGTVGDTERETQSANGETPSSPTTGERGLERFVGEGTVDTFFTEVTTKIDETHDSLDTYRNARADTLGSYMSEGRERVEVSLSEPTSTLATITRTRIEKDESGFVSTVIRAGKAIMSGLYTLVLAVLSYALAHPLVIELLLLIGILYFVYRTARRFGRRPRY